MYDNIITIIFMKTDGCPNHGKGSCDALGANANRCTNNGIWLAPIIEQKVDIPFMLDGKRSNEL